MRTIKKLPNRQNVHVSYHQMLITVNSEIFARILFSRIAPKDTFATNKNREHGMINLYQ